MAVSADELNGYRRDRYFARSWALLTLEKGWWKPVLIMALFGLIPVVGILALVGYALETARVTAWGINAGPKQKDLKFGTYIVTGFKAVVIALAFGLAYSIATGILTFIPVINLILIPVFIVAAFVYPLFINVVQVRASVYGHISAGFAFKNIFEMIKHDMGGLFRIFGMGIVLGIVTSIIMGIIGGSAAISMIVNIGAQAMAIATSLVLSCLLFLHAASFRWDQSSWSSAILVTLLVLSLCFLCRTLLLFGCVSSMFLHGDRAMIHCHHSLTIHVMAQLLPMLPQHQLLQPHQQQLLLLQ